MYTTHLSPEYLQIITLYWGSHDMIGIRESRKLLEIDYSVWIGRSWDFTYRQENRRSRSLATPRRPVSSFSSSSSSSSSSTSLFTKFTSSKNIDDDDSSYLCPFPFLFVSEGNSKASFSSFWDFSVTDFVSISLWAVSLKNIVLGLGEGRLSELESILCRLTFTFTLSLHFLRTTRMTSILPCWIAWTDWLSPNCKCDTQVWACVSADTIAVIVRGEGGRRALQDTGGGEHRCKSRLRIISAHFLQPFYICAKIWNWCCLSCQF